MASICYSVRCFDTHTCLQQKGTFSRSESLQPQVTDPSVFNVRILPLISVGTFLSLKGSLWLVAYWCLSKYMVNRSLCAKNMLAKPIAVPVCCPLRADISCGVNTRDPGQIPAGAAQFFKLWWLVTECIHTVLTRVRLGVSLTGQYCIKT